MKNEELIEELAKAHIAHIFRCSFEEFATGQHTHGAIEVQVERSKAQIRAVLFRLADLGMSGEMRDVVYDYDKYGISVSDAEQVEAAFTASLRALADE
jgi:hypothetical protein